MANVDIKKDEKNELSKDFKFFSLMKFAFPSIFTFVFIAIYQMVDGFFIEKYIGDIAIGAVNLYSPILCLFVAIGVMLGTGGNAIIVKKMGEGKKKEAEITFSETIIISIIIGIICTVICLVFSNNIMRICGASDGNIEYLRPYYMVLCAAAITIILQSCLGILIIGEGKTVTAAVVIIVGGVLNCILDYIFMKYLKLGVMGSALATAIGYSSTIIYAIWYYLIKKKSVYSLKICKINFKEVGVICFNGMSDMISNLAGGITALVMNHIAYNFFGEIGVSSLSVILYFQFLLIAVFMGYTSAVEPIFSYHYGTGNKEKRQKVFKYSLIWIIVISLIILVMLWLLREKFVGIFFDKGTQIFDITMNGFIISLGACMFVGLNIFISGLFTAFSNGLISGILSVVRTLVVLIISLFALSAIFGSNGMWFAWPVTELISLIVSVIFVILYKKKYEYLK